MAATTPAQAAHAAPRGTTPGFGATLASEWTKITSVRATYITIGLGLLLGIGATAGITAIIGATFDDWTPADQASFDPILISIFGTIFSAILFIVFAVNVVASEYSSSMMRLTLTATPRRARVLAAKMTIIAIVTTLAGIIATLGSFAVAQAIFASFSMPTAGLGDSDALRTVLGVGLLSPVFPLFAAALAFVFRSTAAPITATLALFFAPSMFGSLLPRSWQENVLAYLPGPAGDSVSIGHLDEGSALYVDPVVGAIVVMLWLVVFIGGAWLAFTRRDA